MLLTRQGVLGVTLVEETFNPANGETKEVGVWSKSTNAAVPQLGIATRKEREAPASTAAAGDDDDAGGADDNDVPVLVQRGAKPPSAAGAFVVVFKMVAALTVAGFAAGIVTYAIGHFELYGIFLFVLECQGIEAKLFTGFFVISALLVLPNMLTWREFSTAFQVQGAGGPRPRRQPTRSSRPSRLAPKQREERARADAAGDKQDGKGQSGGPSRKDDTTPAKAPEVIEAKKLIIKFFAQCVDFLMKTSSQFLKGGKLSTFNQFGCDLFLAGAAEAYAERKSIPEKNREIMAAVIRAAGRGNDRASQFADKHENYLLEPRYLDMFRAGREAMTVFLKDEDLRTKAASGELSKEDEARLGHDAEGDIGMFLENALDHWNSKADEKKQGGTVAVMFTAILGAFSEATGDDATQKMLHAHNRIVRENLRRYGGNEVKQTNDGIMASFQSASMAVEAAVAIQKGAKLHTAATPDVPLHLKIGINAGEPIAENNDLFGTPVQLAARVCAYAGQDQIAVSKLVFDLCQGKGLKFRDLGGAEFKGFAEKMPVFEARWRDESEMLPE
ncbi:MAG: adenylate/guanylate cyclase domain-containing protein [Alphaproteobacteria bacterium]|nr:adenylate/guanylate cyclase domain-containing protein [Alphaproteobacteria bacterium]